MKLIWNVFDRNFATNTLIFDGKSKQITFNHQFKVLVGMNKSDSLYGSKITSFQLVHGNDPNIKYGVFEFDIGEFANGLDGK